MAQASAFASSLVTAEALGELEVVACGDALELGELPPQALRRNAATPTATSRLSPRISVTVPRIARGFAELAETPTQIDRGGGCTENMVSSSLAGRKLSGLVPIALVLPVALLLLAVATYNGLIRRQNRVDSTWSDIDVLLRRRHDLVPNLVSAVQGYAGHESAVLRAVADSRAAAVTAQGPAARGDAESALSGGVKTLMSVAEAYPDLRASASFVDLQMKLTETEDGLAHARQFYNDAVFAYNTEVQTLPGNLVAGALGFRTRQLFQAAGEERAAGQLRL